MKNLRTGATVITAWLIGLGPASAHAFLTTASLAVGGTVPKPPAEVVINFTEGVEPRFSTIVVTDASGARVDAGKPHLEGGKVHLAVALKPLANGTYKMTATNIHKTQGSFSFTVKRPCRSPRE